MKSKIFIPLIFILLLIFMFSFNARSYNPVIILTYHHLVDENPINQAEITYTDFKAQMQYLAENEYNVISKAEFIKYKEENSFPEKTILLTFDDGYYSFYEYAYPVLKKYDFPAVVFPIISSMPGLERQPVYSDRLSFADMAELNNSSPVINFGSHSYNLHYFKEDQPAIYQQENECCDDYNCRIRRDLRLSRDLLEDQLDKRDNLASLAWPYGYYTERAEEIAIDLGYELIFKLGDRPYYPEEEIVSIPRYGVTSGDINHLKNILNDF